MKGLMLKDLMVLGKQMKVFFLFLLLFCFIPDSAFTFVIAYLGMMPLTAIAYDDRCKWHELSGMMPYTVFELVFSKYLVGYILIAVAMLISVIIGLVSGMVRKMGFDIDIVIEAVSGAAVSIAMISVSLPLLFKFGAEKGRALLILIVCFFVAASTFLFDDISFGADNINAVSFLVLIALVIAAVSAVSVMLSIKFYKKKLS